MYNLNFWQQIIQYGILLNFETYVSTWRTEQAMLEDHSVAILTDIPQNCKVKFINLDASKKYYSSSYQNLRDSKKQEIFEQQLKSGSKNDLSSDETPVMSPEPIRSDSLSAAEKSENNRRNFDLENLNNNILNNSNQAMSDFYTPFITGSSQDLKINIMVPEQVFALVQENLNYNLSEIEVDINTVFFNTGINEEQALADKLNQIYPQDIVNYESCKRLTDYYRKVNNDDWTSKKSGILLLELIEHCQLNPIKNKDVKIQELAQKICRELNAVRYIQCKSAKDRTSMGVSLEQIRIMKDEFELDESLASENLETIRKNGMGLIRCYKNTTKFFYAFNAVQLSTFPRDYKPPKGTYGVGLAS